MHVKEFQITYVDSKVKYGTHSPTMVQIYSLSKGFIQ